MWGPLQLIRLLLYFVMGVPSPTVPVLLVGLEAELLLQDARGRPADVAVGQLARIDEAYELAVAERPGQVDVQTGMDRLDGIALEKGGVGVRVIARWHREPVAEHEALEPEVVSQDVGQQVLVLRGLDAVHLVVRGHHGRDAAVLDDHPEVTAVDLAQRLLVQLRIVGVAVDLDVVRHEVLGVGGDVLLHAHGQRGGQAAHLERVLAVGLLRASPVRMAKQVHARRQQQRLLGGLHLVPDRLADRVLEVQVERRAAGHADGNEVENPTL